MTLKHSFTESLNLDSFNMFCTSIQSPLTLCLNCQVVYTEIRRGLRMRCNFIYFSDLPCGSHRCNRTVLLTLLSILPALRFVKLKRLMKLSFIFSLKTRVYEPGQIEIIFPDTVKPIAYSDTTSVRTNQN